MHRSESRAGHRAAMRTAGPAAVELLLHATRRERREPAPDAAYRRVVSGAAVFRQPQSGRRAGRESQTGAAADALDGHRSALRQAALEPAGGGPRDLSVSAARRGRPSAQSRLEHRYYLRSDARRLSVPGRGDELVQPFRAGLGTVLDPGNRLLRRGAGSGVRLRPAAHFQLRSGRAVYFRAVSGAVAGAPHSDPHGWPRPRAGQRVYRTAVAQCEIRADLSRRLLRRPRAGSGAGRIFSFLQSSAATPGAGIQDASRPVSASQNQKKADSLTGGRRPPGPLGLIAFAPVWTFCLLCWRAAVQSTCLCRRIDI